MTNGGELRRRARDDGKAGNALRTHGCLNEQLSVVSHLEGHIESSSFYHAEVPSYPRLHVGSSRNGHHLMAKVAGGILHFHRQLRPCGANEK